MACSGEVRSGVYGGGDQSGEWHPRLSLSRWCLVSNHTGLLLAMGSSLVVEPAASLPRLAKQHGATLVIINRAPTLQDELADAVVHASIGETLTRVAQLLARPAR